MDPTVELAIDGFPLDSNDPDIRFHRELSTWLELDKARTLPAALMVAVPAPEERWDWLRASLKRFQWVRNHAELLAGGRQFDRRLAELIARLVNRMNFVDAGSIARVHEAELTALASQAAALEQCGCERIFRADTGRLLMDLAKGGLEPSTRTILHSMLRELAPQREWGNRMHELAWHLFLDDDDPDDGDPCWSAAVRRELKPLKPVRRKPWVALLKLAPTTRPPDARWEEKVKKALDRIGREEWEGRVASWCAKLQGAEPLALERPGQALLRLMIEMSGAAESPALASSLVALVDVRWDSPRSEGFWADVALRLALRLYPHPETHAAIRKLAERPECSGLPEIKQIIDEISAAGRAPKSDETGVDGFPLALDPSLTAFQSRIDRLLGNPAGSPPAGSPDDSLRHLLPQASASNKEQLLRALQQRIDWLTANTPALDMRRPSVEWAKFSNWNNLLKSLRSALLRAGAGTDRGELLKLLREGNHAAFDRAAEHTKQHGYQAEIVEAVRQYHDTLHGSVSDQTRRQHVGWWLWLDDVTPIKSEDCWSGIVRADLRGFTGARKKAWMGLIGNMTFAIGSKIPAKWTKAAETALAAVGPEDFANQMRRWLAPMAPAAGDKPLRLTTPGRDVLRILVWTCALCPPDPQLDEALAWIGKATWKNKESRDRMMKISEPLSNILSARSPERAWEALDGLAASKIIAPEMPEFAQYVELSQHLGKQSRAAQAKPAPPARDPQASMQKAMATALRSIPGDRIEIHPDHIFVRGERDHYRIGMDGVVTRRSGRQVRVNIDALPPYLTQLIQPAVDAQDLAQGMFQPNRMRLMSLATILAHDAQWESAIE
jgi:hypothetical protein